MIRRTAVALLLTAPGASAQDFVFRQDCQLTLVACDMLRDGDPDTCPIGLSVTARFHAEGEAFYLRADGLGTDPTDGADVTYSLGQGYYTDTIRIYYILDHPRFDGLFWIAADGNSGAQFFYDGLEDYYTAACTPLPD